MACRVLGSLENGLSFPSTIRKDDYTARLFDIYKQVLKEGVAQVTTPSLRLDLVSSISVVLFLFSS